MNTRELIGLPVSFVIVYGAFLVGAAGAFVTPTLDDLDVAWEPPAEVYVAFDPTGLVEGAGDEAAPAEVEVADGGELGPEEPAAEVVPEAPAAEAVAEAVVDAPAADEVVVEAMATSDAPAVEGDAALVADAAPSAGDAAGGGVGERRPLVAQRKPGVDPAEVKDRGDARGVKNSVTGCEVPHPQIEQLDDTHWVVQRDLIDFYTSSIAVFNTLGWSRRFEGAEGVKGWEIGGFGCKSPLFKGGLRARDVVQHVNGKKTNNVLQIIGIWLGSKKKGEWEVQVLRKGQPVTLRYTVVG